MRVHRSSTERAAFRRQECGHRRKSRTSSAPEVVCWPIFQAEVGQGLYHTPAETSAVEIRTFGRVISSAVRYFVGAENNTRRCLAIGRRGRWIDLPRAKQCIADVRRRRSIARGWSTYYTHRLSGPTCAAPCTETNHLRSTLWGRKQALPHEVV